MYSKITEIFISWADTISILGLMVLVYWYSYRGNQKPDTYGNRIFFGLPLVLGMAFVGALCAPENPLLGTIFALPYAFILFVVGKTGGEIFDLRGGRK